MINIKASGSVVYYNYENIYFLNYHLLSVVHMSNLFQQFLNGILKNSSFKTP